MKEDFTKYTLLELFQLFPEVQKMMSEYAPPYLDDLIAGVKNPNHEKWKNMYSRIIREIASRT